jgi:hypothetical protein
MVMFFFFLDSNLFLIVTHRKDYMKVLFCSWLSSVFWCAGRVFRGVRCDLASKNGYLKVFN